MKFNFQLKGDPCKGITDILARAERNIVGGVGEGVQRNILRNVEGRILRVRTGSMVQAWSGPIRIEEDPRTGGVLAIISPSRTLPYLRIHEYGGEIRPLGPWYLRFQLEDGTIIRTKLVNMPARRYLSISIEQTRPEIEDITRTALAAAKAGQDWFGAKN